MADHRYQRTAPDRGFTLVEVLIVVVMIGIVAAVCAVATTVVVRSSPSAEVRAEDARSLRGLVTWLPQDVDAAPPDGFDRSQTAWPCAGTAPANSINMLTLRWTERLGSDQNFGASYRYEQAGTDWVIARYACDNGGSGPMGGAARNNLTGALPEWNAATPPFSVSMCDSRVDAVTGICPTENVIPPTVAAPTRVRSLTMSITRADGVVSSIDAAPKNPDQDLADDPFAVANHAPKITQTNYVLEMYAGDTAVVDLNSTHAPIDPDGDPISVAIDSSEPLPPGVTASAADPLDVTITANPGLSPGTIATKLVLIISDHRGGWVDATITVKILTEPNDPPTVSPATYHLQIVRGTTVILPIGTTHNATDPNGDPMTVTVLSWPPRLTTPPSTGGGLGPLDVRVIASSDALLGTAVWPIKLQIADNKGATVLAYVTVEILSAAVNNPPTVTTSNIDIAMYAGDSVTVSLDATHGAADPDGDPIVAAIDGSAAQPAGITTTFDGGLGVTVTADSSLAPGALSAPVALKVADIRGAAVGATITITILPTPPPPSDCVLNSLSANPSPVDRQGNGIGPRHLKKDVTVTLSYSGSCDGLVLSYDSGDTSGLGIGTGRVFPPGSPTSIVIYSNGNGGTEKWTAGSHSLTATTTSEIALDSIVISLAVN